MIFILCEILGKLQKQEKKRQTVLNANAQFSHDELMLPDYVNNLHVLNYILWFIKIKIQWGWKSDNDSEKKVTVLYIIKSSAVISTFINKYAWEQNLKGHMKRGKRGITTLVIV